MASKISRAEFLRISCLGAAGIAASSKLDLNAAPNAKTAPDIHFRPSWNSNFVPDFAPRLSEKTRQLAQAGLSGQWGRSMSKVTWNTDDVFEGNPGPQVKNGRAAMSLAKNAPLRLLPDELLTGSATIKEACWHEIPILMESGVSHTTFGFERALNLGFSGLRKEIEDRMASMPEMTEGQKDLYEGMLLTIDASRVWTERQIKGLEEMMSTADGEQRRTIASRIEVLRNVPENKPANFREAIQSLWSMWCFCRLTGNWSGIGRFDKILGPYLEQDLKRGDITLDEARELIAHFWIKGTDWVTCWNAGSGDAQFYQNIILSGIDKYGNDVTNDVTYLVLDVVEELHISDYPIAVRINPRTPDKLLRRIAEVQRLGGGIVSVYNEDVVIEAMMNFGFPLEEAREFTNDGCWETIIPGKTVFVYKPMDMVAVFQSVLHTNDDLEIVDYKTFDELYDAFLAELRKSIDEVHLGIDKYYHGPHVPCVVASLFTEGCVEKGLSYHNQGPIYSSRGIHYGGVSDVANSFLVLKNLVYEQKYLTLPQFVEILRNNWEGKEALRQLVKTRFEFFGNDNPEADAMMAKVVDDYASIVNELKKRNGNLRPGAISTFGREIDWKDMRAAMPEGSKRGDILATNCSPTPGSDRKGPTSVLNSYCKIDFSKLPNGGTLELKILPQSIQGENGVKALMGLAKTFRKKGGFYMHIDVVDSTTLIDAQMHPEKYPNLPVRVAGWSARFTTLDKDWQDMVIQRTQQIV